MAKNKTAPKTGPRRGRPGRDTTAVRTQERDTGWLYGLHTVSAALGNERRRVGRLVATAEGADKLLRMAPDAQPEIVDRQALERLLAPGAVHQGVALQAPPLSWPPLEEIVAKAGESDVLVVLDHVTDPHNIGAVLRSAAAFGALAVVQTERGAPAATGIVGKTASGALEVVPLVAVTNLSRTLDMLKSAGFWCVGLDGEAGDTLARVAPGGRTALVLGAEGKGLRRLTREHCDVLARLPTRPPVASLNVSNAAAVALYELVRDR